MTKIITSDVEDINLDPESLTATSENKTFDNVRRLEAIRDLEKLIDDAENETLSTPQQKSNRIDCFIKFKTRIPASNYYIINAELNSLNQTLVERNSSEIEIFGDDQKLIKLFSFYQNTVYKETRVKRMTGPVRLMLQKKRSSRRRKFSKNDVFIEQFSIKLKGKKINLIDIGPVNWKVSEMKYTFDNNRSSIRILLVRSK
jgi:hypothetical protein